MSVVYIVLPLALLLATAAVIAFVFATKQGQFDDLETPKYRMLWDDQPVAVANNSKDDSETSK